MRKHLVSELEVDVPAGTLWTIYSTTQFPNLVVQLLPTVVRNIEIDGDGSLGSVPLLYKEKIVTIDHEKCLKEVLQIEGGYLDLGCSFYMSSFQNLEKGCDSFIIKSMVTYELAKDANPGVADLITIAAHAAIAQVISKYVLDKQVAATP